MAGIQLKCGHYSLNVSSTAVAKPPPKKTKKQTKQNRKSNWSTDQGHFLKHISSNANVYRPISTKLYLRANTLQNVMC